jgi:BirA family biotin operon repressor/biotin-[acetyl-CoA-carboxylase] ligase
VWKLVRTLQAMGINIESVPRQGYRLPRAVDLLDRNAILAEMSPELRERVTPIEVLLTVDSTNRYLSEQPANPPGTAQVCVAEVQNAGRGRRGRSWVAPFGTGVCMSLSWQFVEAPPWPNDLIWQQRKLGGILIEMRGESAGPAQVVIGLGINMRMPAPVRLMLAEQQAALIADVHEIVRERTPTRNALIAMLAEEITKMLQTFGMRGFEPFADEWRRLDTLADAPVRVMSGTETAFGRARGVELDGTLLVDVDGVLRRFASGEVSLRAAR